MSSVPRDPTNYDVQMIPIETVQPGFSLVVDRGEGRQHFRVNSVRFKSTQQDDGGYVNRHILTSTPPADGSDPWVIDEPAGTHVCRVLGPSKQ